MRAQSCGNGLTPIGRVPQQSFRKNMQREAAIREFCTALPAPVLLAEYGRKAVHPELSQLAWNVGRRMNKAAVTTIKLCYGALDIGVPVDVVLQVPERLASLIRARAGTGAPARSRAEIQRVETELQGSIDRIQVAMMTGTATTSDLLEARKRIAEMQKVLQELDADIEAEINKTTLGEVR